MSEIKIKKKPAPAPEEIRCKFCKDTGIIGIDMRLNEAVRCCYCDAGKSETKK